MWWYFCCSYWTSSSEEESTWIMLFSMGFVSCLLFLLGNPKPKFRKDMKEEDNPSMKVDHLITTSCSFFVCCHLSFSRQFEGWQGTLWKSYNWLGKDWKFPYSKHKVITMMMTTTTKSIILERIGSSHILITKSLLRQQPQQKALSYKKSFTVGHRTKKVIHWLFCLTQFLMWTSEFLSQKSETK